MRILNVPIEPLPERYSVQWDKWFEQEFIAADVDFTSIYGDPVPAEIRHGSFLDVINTNRYKTSQLTHILTELQHFKNDHKLILFFHDLWNPALTTLAYIRDGMDWKETVKIVGCLHAGSYDKHDFLAKKGMSWWADNIEHAWFENIADVIFVATEFHKKMLCNERDISSDRVIVSGFPIYPEFVENNLDRSGRIPIVFPHRLDPEKQPQVFDELSKNDLLQGESFIRTRDVAKTKEAYYHILNRAAFAVSFALQETWGIAMQEATLCGAIPIVPNRLSYPEIYFPQFRYNYTHQIPAMIQRLRNAPSSLLDAQIQRIVDAGATAIPFMISTLRSMYEDI